MSTEVNNNKKASNKKSKKKKKSKIVYLWIILIALIVFLLSKRNKTTNFIGSSILGSNKQTAQAYVEANYLDEDVLSYILDMITKEDRIKLATVYVNKENGSRLSEIPLEMVEEKYKYLFGDDLMIEDTGFVLSTGYIYKKEEEKFDTLEDYEETPVEDSANSSEQGNEAEGTEVNEGNTKLEVLNQIMITDCKAGSNKGEYVVTIEKISPKLAIEFYDYASTHENSGFSAKDIGKLAKMSGMVLPDETINVPDESIDNIYVTEEKQEIENQEKASLQEGDAYLMSLINDSNEEELTKIDYILNLTVREQEGRYVIVDREVKY